MLNLLVELIENGFLAQTFLVILIWGVLGYLYARERPVDENLLHAGLLILGFYFRSAIAQVSTRLNGSR